MIQIMQANDAAKLSVKGKKQFVNDVLEGPEFKNLIREIEENAMKGRTSFSKLLQSKEDVRTYEVFVVALKEAGYTSSIKSKGFNILRDPSSDCVFYVSWRQEDEQN
ncbi:MAG: hypothetical protein R3267_07110 [Paenisporosarcina sp.]|nr:hypothetical protein [Paenisporosarcina sp.]